MKFNIALAGLNIRIESRYGSVFSQCGKYLIPGTDQPDLNIALTEDDLARETAGDESPDPRSAESLAVYRRIAEAVPAFDAFLMHGAAVAIDGSAYIFTAPSGTGKSTHIFKWLDNLDEAYVVNGDKPLIRLMGDTAYACGTPWSGSEHLDTNIMLPLRAIVFMERTEENRIIRVSPLQALPKLMQQVYRCENIEMARKTANLMVRLGKAVPYYLFDFNNFKEDAFRVSYNAIRREE